MGVGAAATFPFLEDFEVDVRPNGEAIHIKVRDGQSQVLSVISCTRPNAPRSAMLLANREGDGQPVIMVAVQCSATEPSVR